MKLLTKIDIAKSDIDINHQTKMMMFGSCFSDNIGTKLLENKFNVNINPFGILYNPASIASSINRLLARKSFTIKDLRYHNNIYQSFMHHGSYSSDDAKYSLSKINEDYRKAAKMIRDTNIFLFTFGTAYTFKLKYSKQVVANCHKFTPDTFIRERLSIDEIVIEWSNILNKLIEINPDAKFIFTVSPIRHWKDGAHENVISKSILHLAIDRLQTIFPNIVSYFPAYEILIDELRDYRFYADDMVHPSSLAVEYIWNKFHDTYFSETTQDINKQWNKLSKAMSHRSTNQNEDNYKKFLIQTRLRVMEFARKYPYIDCSPELSHLKFLITL
ncbi:MAG: GSCFA domain-containing protein [Proteiniphilum sp.]|nr:GSCFA domain-containing protein [Proteiniphilum sp.]